MATKLLNDEIIKKFSEEVKSGLPMIYCCHILGLVYSSVMRWLKQGESDMESEIESIECRFYKSVKWAYACFIKQCKETITRGTKDWQGTAWWLERTNDIFKKDLDNASSAENITVVTRMVKK